MSTELSMKPTEKQANERAKLLLLVLAMVASVIMFGGWSSAVIVRQSDKNWFQFGVPFDFTISTILIMVSSIFMVLGTFFTKRGNRLAATLTILTTFILGILFCVFQWEGWKELVRNGIFVVDNLHHNVSGQFFYILTAAHMAHVFGGLIALLVTFIRSAAGKYKPDSYLGLKLCSIYWHFLGGLWLYLFLFWNFSDKLF